MKRLFFILTAVVMAASTMAESIIPQDFYGVRLGKSTQKEVDRILTAEGLTFSPEASDSTNFVYVGDCKHENMEFDYLVTRYINDALIFFGFYGNCDSACVDYGKSFVQKIHSKYDKLQIADSSLYYLTLTSDADSMGLAKWGRKDDNSMIVTMNNDTACICIYFAENYLRSYMVNTILELLKKDDPDYAEENKVTGVAGVRFGDSREYVRKVMSSKAEKLLDSDSHSLHYYKAKIGGLTYDYAVFYFVDGRGLVSVNLQSAFYSWREEEAKRAYENVVSQFKRKYTNFKEILNESDEKASTCGAYTDEYDYKPILITFQKALSKGGDMMFYVQVDYFQGKRVSLYDDEI
jgi:hypothetical protein